MFWDGRRNLKNWMVSLHEGLFGTGSTGPITVPKSPEVCQKKDTEIRTEKEKDFFDQWPRSFP